MRIVLSQDGEDSRWADLVRHRWRRLCAASPTATTSARLKPRCPRTATVAGPHSPGRRASRPADRLCSSMRRSSGHNDRCGTDPIGASHAAGYMPARLGAAGASGAAQASARRAGGFPAHRREHHRHAGGRARRGARHAGRGDHLHPRTCYACRTARARGARARITAGAGGGGPPPARPEARGSFRVACDRRGDHDSPRTRPSWRWPTCSWRAGGRR